MGNNLLDFLHSRGLVKDITNKDGLLKRLESGSITLYCGYDLTADSLHVGNLTTLMVLRWFLKFGHKVIVILGGATSKIGDPTFKDKERPIIPDEQLFANKNGIKKSITTILASDNVTFLDNIDWLGKLGYIEFLNEVGRFFSISKMLSLESVSLRLEREQSMSLTEFNYSVLQGYDFCVLAKDYDCVLQIGGSDQWGNIVSGTEFTRRKLSKEVFGLTIPLLTTFDGKKMGKSESGAIWINNDKISAFDYFQYFRNVDDRDVSKMLKIFTELDVEEIDLIDIKGQAINAAKEKLAFEATKIAMGEVSATEALNTAKSVYLKSDTANGFAGEVLSVSVGFKLLDVIVDSGFAKSKSEAKALISQGGVKVNEVQVLDYSFAFNKVGEYIVSIGKKKFFKVISF